ncbi:class F sortase [Knoellia sp. 3-2P3]|uniref:class F sortase n=1 Tax=unclassified Knoellia TaxID=2618719 RepID=UPI0023DB8C52|nr:class F sortase [Knoellia sp. 3-2P3]MDF2090786.1 class F sortase [Knoellia sp. 3-2P3]
MTDLVAGALLLAAAGVGAVRGVGPQPGTDAGDVPAAVVAERPTTSTGGPAAPSASPPPTRGSLTVAPDLSFRPTVLRVPAIDVDAPVVSTRVDATGALVVPESPREVGWWSGGAAPGAPYGTILMAGHVDSAEEGLGSLVDLSRTPVGATVTVRGAGGSSATYRVVARRSYPKATLPWRDLFRQDVRARLLLVTCGGEFDRRTGHYERNVVVFAVPA